jgi:hypothetical protein
MTDPAQAEPDPGTASSEHASLLASALSPSIRPCASRTIKRSAIWKGDRLRLIRSENVGPITFRRLLDRFGSATAAVRGLPDLALQGGRRAAIRICSAGEADTELAALAARRARLVVYGDPEYPPQLAAIEDAPATFAVIGDAALPSRPCIAVVGSRNASLNGRRLARDLGSAGFVVVSGLARGIDAEAHRGALATGTVAVLASGVDVCYPQENCGTLHADRRGARSSPKRGPAWRHRRATFPGETGSSRGSVEACWWSRQTCARAR